VDPIIGAIVSALIKVTMVIGALPIISKLLGGYSECEQRSLPAAKIHKENR
jgi:hypothetical protein